MGTSRSLARPRSEPRKSKFTETAASISGCHSTCRSRAAGSAAAPCVRASEQRIDCTSHLALCVFLYAFGSLRCEIGQNAVGAGPFEREQGFHHGAFAVDPAIASGCRNHRVFAGDLVGEG